MAELTRPQSVADRLPPIPASTQLLAVAWLRWRIFVNGAFRKQPKTKRQIVGLLFGILLRMTVWSMLALMVVGPVVGSGYLAWSAIAEDRPGSLAPLLLGITALWQFVSINGLGISAAMQSFDPASLIRYPLRFGRYFVLRSLLGLLTPSTIVGCLALLAVAVGIGIADPVLALPALMTMAVYALMNIYLTRMIGAWMERWLANRRLREIFSMVMGLAFAALQFMNLQRSPMHAHGVRSSFLSGALHSSGPWLYWLPPGFAAQAILLAKQPLAALVQLVALLASAVLFAAIFAIRLKRQFLGEYIAEGVSRRTPAQAAPRPKAPTREIAATSVPAVAGPILSPTIAACLRKDWLILRSNGAQLISMMTPLLLVAVFSMNRSFSNLLAGYFLPAAIAYTLMSVLGPLYNVFGADGRGAQLYLLAPVRIRDVVVAKNLLSLMLIVADAGIAWTLVCTLSRASIPLSAQVSTALWMVFVVALNLAVGTLRSIQAPRYFVPGQSRNPRAGVPTNRTSALLVLGVLLGSTFMQIPVVLVSISLDWPWLGAWVYAPLAAAAVFGYVLVIENAERLLLAHRDVFAEELCKA
jgi:ABC-2 type transport system permease protein